MKIKNLLKAENWWIIILSSIILWMLFTIFTQPEYNKALNFIIPGLRITFLSTIVSFIIAIFLGLISGIGRISDNKIASTLSRTYIEFIRGVPVLILIFTIAFVVVVDAAELLNINNGNVPMLIRAIIALSVFYLAAFYLLTFVVDKLPIAIVYATWSGLGIFTIAILGYIFFKQTLAWQAILGLFLIVIGVIMVNYLGRAG